MTLATGQVVQNRYRIISFLSKGGMGTIYRAWHLHLNIPVAIKEMIPQPDLPPAMLATLRQQFQREAAVLARLDHPHLVGVIDFFEEEDNVYLVMKFIEGESLGQHIGQQGPLPEGEVLTWAGQLLDALAYCHAQGVLHRDIKPHNVIIRPDGRAVLVDFGLVKLWDPHDPRTRTAMRGMGTPEYAPPEQYHPDRGYTDARTDIYGLGATLYHALTGQAPPTATERTASRHAFQQPRTLNPHISPSAEAVVLQAMELAVEDRFQSVREMQAALAGTLADSVGTQVISARPAPAIQTKKKRPIPIRVWGLGIAAALAMLTLVAGVVLMFGGRGERAATTPQANETGATVTAALTHAVQATATESPLPSPTATGRPSHTPTSTPTRIPTAQPTSTPASAWTSTPTSIPTRTPAPTWTSTPTSIPTRTPAPTWTSTPTSIPTRTPAPTWTSTPMPIRTATQTPRPQVTATPLPPRATAPEPVAPDYGGEYRSPVTFQWRGALGAGQAYQVTARHTESGHTLQSGLLADQSWTADLPGDKYGEWRWTVSVVQGGNSAATSAEWMFWFNPRGGDGGGDGGPEPTNTPPR